MRLFDVDKVIRKYIDPDIKKFSNSDVKIVLENLKQNLLNASSIDICFCRECTFADEKPIADGRYWCAIHQCFMRFCSDGKEMK